MRFGEALVIVLAAMIAAGAVLFLRGCGVRLPGGYELVQPTSDYFVIAHRPDDYSIIEGNVEGYKVIGNTIVGYAGPPPPPAGPVETGYFIIRGHRIIQGLSKKQWLAHLNAYGISEEPHLDIPRR